MLDIFRSNAFSLVAMTDRINKMPYKPGRIGASGLFTEKGIKTTTVVIEEKSGRLELIQTTPRGGPPRVLGPNRRKARSFIVPHLEKESTIIADEVQDVRAFGSEDATESVQAVVDERQAELKAMHEVTLEHMRVGAIKGEVLDADGSVLINLYDEFDVAQTVMTFDLSADGPSIRAESVAVARAIEDVIGGEQLITGYRGFAGDAFFDALIENESVMRTYENQEGKILREDLRKGFEFAGIIWENYRGRVGGVDFFPSDEAYVVPTGTGMFKTYFAPADFIETVNTIGLPLYSKIVYDPELNRWVKVHTQSNPLTINLRPDAVVKLEMTT